MPSIFRNPLNRRYRRRPPRPTHDASVLPSSPSEELPVSGDENNTLDLSTMNLTRIPMSSLTSHAVGGQWESLTYLDVSNNAITSLRLELGVVVPNLKVLKAANNAIRDVEVSNLQRLERLDVSGNAITVATFETGGALTDLNLSRNSINLVDPSQSIRSTVTTLRVERRDNQADVNNSFARVVLFDKVTTLYAGGGMLSASDLLHIGRVARLTHLDLSKALPLGSLSQGDGLRYCECITTLILSGMGLLSLPRPFCCTSLRRSLVHLDLSSNSFTTVSSIVDAGGPWESLRTLILLDNLISKADRALGLLAERCPALSRADGLPPGVQLACPGGSSFAGAPLHPYEDAAADATVTRDAADCAVLESLDLQALSDSDGCQERRGDDTCDENVPTSRGTGRVMQF